MKRLLYFLCLTAPLPAFAQSLDSVATRVPGFTRDLGFFQQATTFGAGQLSFGLQYRTILRSGSPARWLRAGAGFTVGTSYKPEQVRPLARDTALSVVQYWSDRGALAYVGFERERHFFGNIHLFAAADALLGYTAGRVDSGAAVRRYEANGNYTDLSSTLAEDVRTVQTGFGGVQASVGGRGYSRRVVASVEVLIQARAGLVREREANTFDLSLGGLGYRLAVGYRF